MTVAMLLAAALQSASLSPPQRNEVVVIGQRLKTWRGSIPSVSRSPMLCRTTKSTGDREIDRIGCKAMVACFTRFRDGIVATGDRNKPGAIRESLRLAVQKEIGACLDERRDTLVAELADRRFHERQKN